MDWQFKSIARRSALSGTLFSPGDRVICLIYMDTDAGELGRADVLEAEAAEFELPGKALGRWARTVRNPDEAGAQARETMASAEDFFLSLFENAPGETTVETDVVKHLLALMLERKRVLRVLGRRQREGRQHYLHVKSKQEYSVPLVELSAELMNKIEETLGDILL